MIITDEARDLLVKLLEDENKNCLSFAVISYGCHGQLSIDFVDEESAPYSINGINVTMDDPTAEALEGVTIDCVDGSLVFRTSGGCGGCGGGCHGNCESCGGDDDEEGCCCSDDEGCHCGDDDGCCCGR